VRQEHDASRSSPWRVDAPAVRAGPAGRRDGWAAARIIVIDDDRANTGPARSIGGVSSGGHRGFPGACRAGCWATEMSRLARSGKDGYQLIELCADGGCRCGRSRTASMTPVQYNDRLVRHEVLRDRKEVKKTTVAGPIQGSGRRMGAHDPGDPGRDGKQPRQRRGRAGTARRAESGKQRARRRPRGTRYWVAYSGLAARPGSRRARWLVRRLSAGFRSSRRASGRLSAQAMYRWSRRVFGQAAVRARRAPWLTAWCMVPDARPEGVVSRNGIVFSAARAANGSAQVWGGTVICVVSAAGGAPGCVQGRERSR